MRGVIVRPVTIRECRWLDEDLPVGRAVHKFTGNHYGVVSAAGVGVLLNGPVFKEGKNFCVEIPTDAVEWDYEK